MNGVLNLPTNYPQRKNHQFR